MSQLPERHLREPRPEPALSADDLIAGAGDAILGLSPTGTVLLWNAACEALFGWRADEVVGRSVQMLVPPSHRDDLARLLPVLAGKGEAAAVETERLRKSGDRVPVACRLSPVRDADGRVVGMSAVVRDLSREIELRTQLERSRSLAVARFEQSVVAQASLTPTGIISEVNAALCRLSGYPMKDLLGRPVGDFMTPPEADLAAAGLTSLAQGESPGGRHPRLLRHADGHYVETRVSVFPVVDERSGVVLRVEAVIEDVSAEAAAHREMHRRETRWRSLAQHSADVALFCDADATLLFVGESVTAVLGYPVEALYEADGWSFVHPDDVAEVRAVWDATAAAALGATTTLELRLQHADGRWLWIEGSLTNHLDDPEVEAMVVNLRDVTERKAAEAVLDELSGTDALTGLATRASLVGALDVAFAGDRAASTAVAVVDVARMKLINATYGHKGGDAVLQEMGRRLTAAAGPGALVARIGGDRFAVLLTDVHDVADVFEAAAALKERVEPAMAVGDIELVAAVAVGAALGPAVESGALVAAAEQALQTAKEDVTGPIHVQRAESASVAVTRARLVEDLRRGLAAGELVTHFQPVMSLAHGTPVAAEALVRWAHPDKGLLSPAAFIGAAEESGLIVDVGQQVLEAACRAAARWAAVVAPSAFQVAVNLSARQLTRSNVVDIVRDALATAGALPQHLMLEVTESAVMSDVDAAVRTLQQLRQLGVAIAVDDFGTGYSSLTYLKEFPVTALKIDRSFVGGLGVSDSDAAIVTAVINLARSLDLECIAEGIETEQQRLTLQALGCELGQGYLWAPALDVDTFDAWLRTATSNRPAPPRQDEPANTAAPARRASTRSGRSATAASPATAVSADVAALVRELHHNGASAATVAAALNAAGHVTPRGKRWTSRSVASLLVALPRH